MEFASGVGVWKGDSECCEDVNWLVGAKRLRASDADGEWIPDGVAWRSSLRCEAALCVDVVTRETRGGGKGVPRSLCVQTGSLGLHSLRETFARAWGLVS